MTVTALSPTPHADQSYPREWTAVEHAGETLVVHDVPERLVDCYRVVGESRNPRAMIHADAVLYEGSVCEAYYDADARTVKLFHEYAGNRGRYLLREWLDEPVVLLEECEPVELLEDDR
ncbi:hypothetical protein [Halostella litorea]|uniref:hypothetical protein n=1 Tax=Halostella litorea TaxID=2528831 RepID=UPI001092465A|nr:hypothetical protein [Halostella litorea]